MTKQLLENSVLKISTVIALLGISLTSAYFAGQTSYKLEFLIVSQEATKKDVEAIKDITKENKYEIEKIKEDTNNVKIRINKLEKK